VSGSLGQPVRSVDRLRLREIPGAAQDLGAGPIEPHGVVPSLDHRQAVGYLAVAAAELDGDGTITALLCRQVVDRVGIGGIFLEVAGGVVDTDRQNESTVATKARLSQRDGEK